MIRRYYCFAWHRVPCHTWKWWRHYPLSLSFVLRTIYTYAYPKLLPGTTVRCTIYVSNRYTKAPLNSTIRSGVRVSLFRCYLLRCVPWPPGIVRPSIVLSHRYRLSFYRYRYRNIEILSIRYYRFLIERCDRKFRYDIQHYQVPGI